jgi:hypothetical protein
MHAMLRSSICVVALLAIAAAAPTGANAQSATGDPAICQASGPYIFMDIPTDIANMLPSLKKKLSALGLVARRGGCNIAVTCVATEPNELQHDVARKRCGATTRAMVLTAAKDRRTSLREGFDVRSIKTLPGFAAGAVVVYLK